MNARIVHIASNTFREAVRDRVLYNLIAFALLLSGAAIFVGQISIEIERLVVVNLGLTAVSHVRRCDRHLYRHRSGFEGNREAHTVHGFVATGAPMGVYCRQVFRTCRHAGGEHIFHGASEPLRRAAVCCSQVLSADASILVALYFIVLRVFLIICSIWRCCFRRSLPRCFRRCSLFRCLSSAAFADDLRGFAYLTHGLTRWIATGARISSQISLHQNVITAVAHQQAVSSQLILQNTLYALFYMVRRLVAPC